MTAVIKICLCGKVYHRKKQEWLYYSVMQNMTTEEFLKYLFHQELTQVKFIREQCTDCQSR